MDAVCCDQQFAVIAATIRAGFQIYNRSTYPVSGLLPVVKMVPCQNCPLTKTRSGCFQQFQLQYAAMNRQLRPVVSGFYTSWLTPDRLAMAIEVRKFRRL